MRVLGPWGVAGPLTGGCHAPARVVELHRITGTARSLHATVHAPGRQIQFLQRGGNFPGLAWSQGVYGSMLK